MTEMFIVGFVSGAACVALFWAVNSFLDRIVFEQEQEQEESDR